MVDTSDPVALRAALGAFFPESEIECRVGNVSKSNNTRASVLWYINARSAMHRLDEVFGPAGWQTRFETAFDRNMVVCHLSCKINGEWVTKSDVGALSDQPDEGDKYKAAFCLPLDAQALTRSGWKNHDQLEDGDEILAYDAANDVCRWSPLLAVNVFNDPQPMLQLDSKSFRMQCTPNHRWVVRRRNKGVLIKSTSDLDAHDAILIAAPCEGGDHPLTPKEASILGWVATDGYVARPSENQLRVVITQAKEPHRSDIRSMLGQDASEYDRPIREGGVVAGKQIVARIPSSMFYLKAGFAKELFAKAGLGEWKDLHHIIPALSAEARGAMFQAMMAGDGHHSRNQLKFGKGGHDGVMEAFEILATLQGIALGTTTLSTTGNMPLRTLRKLPHTWAKCLSIKEIAPAPCWCPTTPLGTWVTRWQDNITITGNSDALKRAAVHWGIGRYLYDIPFQQHEYDPKFKRFASAPRLPAAFNPARQGNKPAPAPRPQPQPQPQEGPPAEDAQAQDAQDWKAILIGRYEAVKTKADFQEVNQFVRENPHVKEGMSAEDSSEILEAATKAKARYEENNLIAQTPFGG